MEVLIFTHYTEEYRVSDFSLVTNKTEVTIACDGNVDFFEKIKAALELSWSTKSPVSVRKWLTGSCENMFAFIGLIVLAEGVAERHDVENLAASFEGVFPSITGSQNSPLAKEKVILCRADNILLIETFSEMHGLSKETMLRSDSAISYWSNYQCNLKDPQSARVLKRTPYLQ